MIKEWHKNYERVEKGHIQEGSQGGGGAGTTKKPSLDRGIVAYKYIYYFRKKEVIRLN